MQDLTAKFSPVGFLVEGLFLVLAGCFLLVAGAIGSRLEDPSSALVGVLFFALMAVLMTVRGFQCFRSFARFSGRPIGRPSRETLRFVQDLVKVIVAASPKDSTDIVEFRASARVRSRKWRGKLLSQMAVLVEGKGEDILIAMKEDIHLFKEEGGSQQDILLASFRIGDLKTTGAISPFFFDRYQTWKSARSN